MDLDLDGSGASGVKVRMEKEEEEGGGELEPTESGPQQKEDGRQPAGAGKDDEEEEKEKKKAEEKEKEKQDEASLKEKISESLAKADLAETAEKTKKFEQLLNSYFQWKSLYERETKFIRKQLHDKYLKGQYAKDEYCSMVQNLVHPCVRCSSKEGMKFERKLFRPADREHFPNIYVYLGVCRDLAKPCMHVELYTGEVADFHDLFAWQKKEVEQMQQEIVALKLDTLFQYKTANESIEIFHSKKKLYQETKLIFDTCHSTVEILAKPSAQSEASRSLVSQIRADLQAHYDKYSRSQFHLTHEFEMGSECEKALMAEEERLMLHTLRDISVVQQQAEEEGAEEEEDDEEEGGEEADDDEEVDEQTDRVVNRLTKVPASAPPRHCILHNDPPKIVHFHCLAQGDYIK